jgi:DNA processing protein
MAFPGRTDDVYSAGCHQLIQSHQAHLISSAQDLVPLLGWDEENKPAPVRVIPKGLSDAQIRILQLLIQGDDPHIDVLCYESQYSPQQLSLLLLELEMQGLVQGLPGKKYRCLI